MRVNFIDTNVVIYSVSDNDYKYFKALSLLAQRPVISVQVLNETANILRRKLGFTVTDIRHVIAELIKACQVLPMLPETTLTALHVAERYGYSLYDCLIIAAALNANCTTLYSEDMQHEQLIDNKLLIINPFR